MDYNQYNELYFGQFSTDFPGVPMPFNYEDMRHSVFEQVYTVSLSSASDIDSLTDNDKATIC
jgi:hypothetical protein